MVYKITALVSVGIALIAGVIVLAREGLSDKAKRILLGLVTQAEEQFGDGCGKIKLSAVAGWLYSILPRAFGWLVSGKTVETWINQAVDRMKETLEK